MLTSMKSLGRSSLSEAMRLEKEEWARIEVYRGHVSKRFENEGVTLSNALRTHSSTPNIAKLSMVNCSISLIDQIPRTFCENVRTLYLSNNNLLSLKGIEQFNNTQSLSCANNLIRYLGEIRWLNKLEGLEKIVLEGNVVTSMPFYRDYIIGMCPKIASIDGIKVSTNERHNAKSTARKAQSFYDQLRLNELRNVILKHLECLLPCHTDMVQTVMGSFRSVRGSHLPSRDEMVLDGNCGMRKSIGSILKQCLLGGVFRWLQIACVDDFDRAVQELAYKAHLMLLRKLSSAQRHALHQSPEIQSPHWDDVTRECLQHQQAVAMQHLAGCEYHTASTPQQWEIDGPVHDSMNYLQQIHFEMQSPTSAEIRRQYCGVGGDCASTCFLADPVLRRKPSSDVSGCGMMGDKSWCQSSKSVSGGGPGPASRMRGRIVAKDKGRKERESTGGSFGDEGDEAAVQEQERVEDKYNALLQLMQKQGRACGMLPTGLGSGSAPSLSSYLPPQQVEPPDLRITENHAVGGDGAMLRKPHNVRSDCGDGVTLESVESTDASAGSDIIEEFLHRTLTGLQSPSIGDEGAYWVEGLAKEMEMAMFRLVAVSGPSDRDSLAEAAGEGGRIASLLEEGPLTPTRAARARLEALGPGPRIYVRPEMGKAMRSMKMQVEQAVEELTMCRRVEVLNWEANTRLRDRADGARRACTGGLDIALGRMQALRKEKQSYERDMVWATNCLKSCENMLRLVEEGRKKVYELGAVVENEKQLVRELSAQIDGANRSISAITNSLSEVGLAQRAADDDLRGECSLAEYIEEIKLRVLADQWRMTGASHGPSSSSLSSSSGRGHGLLGRMLWALRLRVRRQRRIRAFAYEALKRRRGELIQAVLHMWVDAVRIGMAGRRLRQWALRGCALRHLSAWKRKQRKEVIMKEMAVRRWDRACCRALAQWREANAWGEERRRRRREQAAFLLDFLKARVFQAWSRHTASCRPTGGPADMAAIIKAKTHLKSRILFLWMEIVKEQGAEVREKAQALRGKHAEGVKREVWGRWRELADACRYYRMRVCERVFDISQSRVMCWRHQTHCSALASSHFMRVHLRKVWKRLRWLRARAKWAHSRSRHLRLSNVIRLARRAWALWRMALIEEVNFRAKDMSAISHYLQSIIKSNFGAWRHYVNQVNGRAGVGVEIDHGTGKGQVSIIDDRGGDSFSENMGAFRRISKSTSGPSTCRALAVSYLNSDSDSTSLLLGPRNRRNDFDIDDDEDDENFRIETFWTKSRVSSLRGSTTASRRMTSTDVKMRWCLRRWSTLVCRRCWTRAAEAHTRFKAVAALGRRAFFHMAHTFGARLLTKCKALRSSVTAIEHFPLGGRSTEQGHEQGRRVQTSGVHSRDSLAATNARDKEREVDVEQRLEFVSLSLAQVQENLQSAKLTEVDVAASLQALSELEQRLGSTMCHIQKEINVVHLICNFPPFLNRVRESGYFQKFEEEAIKAGMSLGSDDLVLGALPPTPSLYSVLSLLEWGSSVQSTHQQGDDSGGSVACGLEGLPEKVSSIEAGCGGPTFSEDSTTSSSFECGSALDDESDDPFFSEPSIEDMYSQKNALLRDVEVTYNHAVIAQTDATRRHGHLSTAQVQAAALLEEARARSAKSDSCEVALRSQRRMTEDSIRRITAAITDSLQKMAQSAAQLRRLEVQLEDEEQDLLRRGAEAQEEEEVLRKELTTLTQQVSIYKNSVARFTLPTSQALTELDAWTIFNANRATRHVLDNQWGHRAVLTAQSIRMLLAEETGSRPELLVRCKVCPGDKVGLSINEKENALECVSARERRASSLDPMRDKLTTRLGVGKTRLPTGREEISPSGRSGTGRPTNHVRANVSTERQVPLRRREATEVDGSPRIFSHDKEIDEISARIKSRLKMDPAIL